MQIAVDIGNSGAKAAAFAGDRLVARARFDPEGVRTREDLCTILGVEPAGITAIAVVSVSEPGLAAFLAGSGAGALVVGREIPIQVENRYREPAEVGLDRLVNAVAAFSLAGGAAIAVDLGSAVTVDAVGGDGAFLGGAIAPGRPAFTAGLRAAAPALPAWDGAEPAGGIPLTTTEAIREGVVEGLAGLIGRLVERTRDAFRGEDPAVFLTGGDASLVSGRLPFESVTVPHLTLTGVRLLLDRHRRDPCT